MPTTLRAPAIGCLRPLSTILRSPDWGANRSEGGIRIAVGGAAWSDTEDPVQHGPKRDRDNQVAVHNGGYLRRRPKTEVALRDRLPRQPRPGCRLVG